LMQRMVARKSFSSLGIGIEVVLLKLGSIPHTLAHAHYV